MPYVFRALIWLSPNEKKGALTGPFYTAKERRSLEVSGGKTMNTASADGLYLTGSRLSKKAGGAE